LRKFINTFVLVEALKLTEIYLLVRSNENV
jgi:hypothetical protein